MFGRQTMVLDGLERDIDSIGTEQERERDKQVEVGPKVRRKVDEPEQGA